MRSTIFMLYEVSDEPGQASGELGHCVIKIYWVSGLNG